MAFPSPAGYSATVDEEDLEALRWRAWLAYHQLPYGEDGRLPSYRSLEESVEPKLPNATLAKMFRGKKKRPGRLMANKIAKVLRVEPEWLWEGRGSGPPTVRGAPPLPKVKRRVPVISDGGLEGSGLKGGNFRELPDIRRSRR